MWIRRLYQILVQFGKVVRHLPFGNFKNLLTSASWLCITSMCLASFMHSFLQNGQHSFFGDWSDVIIYMSRMSHPNSLLGLMVNDSVASGKSARSSSGTWKFVSKHENFPAWLNRSNNQITYVSSQLSHKNLRMPFRNNFNGSSNVSLRCSGSRQKFLLESF